MVNTRNSISTPDLEAEIDADADISPEHKRRLKNAVKKLQIDALPALKGEKVRHDESATVYHYRGFSYAVTDLTPKEWLDKEPPRYKKRRSTGTGTDVEDTRRASIKEQPKEKAKIKEMQGRKRARTPEPEEEQEEPASKRPRRHSERYTHDYSRPKDISDFTPGKRKTRGRQVDRMYTSRMNDYTRVGGHETLSCIEHARRRAAMEGYVVKALTPKQLLPPQQRRRINGPKTVRENVGMNLVRLAKLNSRIDKVDRDLKLSKDVLRQFETQRAEAKRASVVSAQVALASTAALLTHEPTPPSHTPVSTEEQANATHISDLEDSPEQPSRHDSGASVIPDEVDQSTEATTDLPAKNKAGQGLRWSLPEKLNDNQYAENAINKARLTGESKSARRRRVKRELKLVKSWAATSTEIARQQEEEEAGAGEEQVEEGGEVEEVELQVRTPTTEEENGTVDSAERRSSRVPKQRNQVCRDWMLGACWRGDRCTYVHE